MVAFDKPEPESSATTPGGSSTTTPRVELAGSEPIYTKQLASLLQFAGPAQDNHTLTGDEALAGLTLLAALRD
ncbi:hypothetical protein [Streptosporangium sp. NPDC002607]